MRTLIVSEFISLDGVIQAPGGKDEDLDGGFQHGGWTWPYALHHGAERGSDVVVPVDAMNAPKKYVVSRTLEADLA